MHPQFFLLALVAPLALSLPQPIDQGGSSALVARQESGNSTAGDEGGHHKETDHSRPAGHHPERDLVERQDSGNSTGGAREGGPHGYTGEKHHSGPSHPERDLSERQESGNSTGGGEHHGDGRSHHGGPPHPERDLSERQESGNSTGGGEHHGAGNHHHEDHLGPKIDKRIEEGNGTTGGETGGEKFKPDGYHGGPQRPDEHKRSIIDTILHRRQDNSTSSGGEGESKGKHWSEQGYFGHKEPE